MRQKSPSELSSRTIRISIGDYALLSEISRRADVTFAEALHLLITNQAKQEAITRIPPAQIPMPAFRVTGVPAFRVAPVTTVATNGNKGVVFRIKSRGVRRE